MGLFSVLNTGTRALFASQLSMDVAGQNISNADVDGYSRKRLNMTSDYRTDSAFGQIGMGVDVINIERMRNTFIDQQIRRQNQEVGYFSEVDTTLESIENIFTEPGDSGLLHFVDQFFDSWQNLANNPSDISARTMVKTNGQILTDVFHNIGGELQGLRQTRNEEISQRVDKVNKITEEVFNLNLEIGAVESGNQNANDSRDRRDLLLKELSSLIEVDTLENQNGQITLTTSGNILVSPVYFQKLEITSSTYKANDGTNYSDIGIRFADSKRPYLPQGGEIKGLLDSRDVFVPNFQEKIDLLARTIVAKVNETHSQGYTLNGYNGIDFFDPNVTGAIDINLSSSIISNIQNIAAASAGEIHPGAQNVLAAGTHNFGTPPLQLFRDPLAAPPVNARNIVRNTVLVSSPSGPLTEGVDYHIDYVNGTFQMLHAGYDASELRIDLQYRTGGFQGQGDNSNAVNIAQLRNEFTMKQDLLGNPTTTFAEYYSSYIGELGLSRNQAESNLTTRNFLVDQYEAHQDAIAGVSLDEEMANLVKFQHTYQAAARLISVTDKMLDVLLNM